MKYRATSHRLSAAQKSGKISARLPFLNMGTALRADAGPECSTTRTNLS